MADVYVDPEREAFEAFKALPRDEPIAMLNLVRFREHALYPDGHAFEGTRRSGADAYREYGRASGPVFARVGGTILWRGAMQGMLIGPQSERWDTIFIARYPNAGAFLAMVTDPEYRVAVAHRQAAVETSRLIRCKPLDSGGGFA
jgi:uncharacterized protein (DUF1330 family)